MDKFEATDAETLECAHEHHRHAAAPPKSYRFPATVSATSPAPGKVEFELKSPLQQIPDGPLVFDKSNNSMNKPDYYLVDFELEDKTSLGLRFNPNPMKALWVAMGDALNAPPCPTSACYCDDVYATSVDQTNGTKMTIRNNDPKFQNFTFSLGFIGDPEESEYRFDPGGQNMNGGTGVR